MRSVKIDSERDLHIPIMLEDTSSLKIIEKKALTHCGATDSFSDRKLVEKERIEVTNLQNLVPIYQSDGKKTSTGDVTGFTDLKMDYKGHQEIEWFYVTGLGDKDIFLGLSWLKKHNPEVNLEKRSR